MNEQFTQIVEKLKNSPELIKNIQNKDDAIKLIAKETKMPEANSVLSFLFNSDY